MVKLVSSALTCLNKGSFSLLQSKPKSKQPLDKRFSSWSLNTPSVLNPRVTDTLSSNYSFFVCFVFLRVLFNVDLLYIIVMFMLPDGLENHPELILTMCS